MDHPWTEEGHDMERRRVVAEPVVVRVGAARVVG
jgi:hypothetical protein